MSGDDGKQALSLLSENVADARFGTQISKIGDFNGDGINDFAASAPGINKVTIFFGTKSKLNSEIDLSALTQQMGFSITGPDDSDFGESIGFVGDFNKDGLDDFLIGAAQYTVDAGTTDKVGAGILIFGHRQPSNTTMTINDLGSNKLILHGNAFLDTCGSSVAGNGDLNDDGYLDLVVGCERAAKDKTSSRGGVVYVYLGHAGPYPEKINLSTLDGNNGFRFTAASFNDQAGASVTYVGDVNNDSIIDLHIGTHPSFVTGGELKEGLSYIYYGNKGPFNQSISLNDITQQQAFKITGEIIQDSAGAVASALGDINKDGIDDFIVGSRVSYVLVHENHPGRAYVIYGETEKKSADLALTSLDGEKGFIIGGETDASAFGYSVSGDFDYDNDGNRDFIVSARLYSDSVAGNSLGRSYLVFGPNTSLPQFIDLPNTSGLDIISITGFQAFQYAGESVAQIGDFNGDGYDDIAVGMPGTKSSSGKVRAGAVLLSLGHSREVPTTSTNSAPQETSSAAELTNMETTLKLTMNSYSTTTASSMFGGSSLTTTESPPMNSDSALLTSSMFGGGTLTNTESGSMNSLNPAVSAAMRNQNANLNLVLLIFTLTTLINLARSLMSSSGNEQKNPRTKQSFGANKSAMLFHRKHEPFQVNQQKEEQSNINSSMRM